MVDYGRDLNIGMPVETTLKDIHNKLSEVDQKINDASGKIEETNLELKQIRLGTGLITGVDLSEEDGT